MFAGVDANVDIAVGIGRGLRRLSASWRDARAVRRRLNAPIRHVRRPTPVKAPRSLVESRRRAVGWVSAVIGLLALPYGLSGPSFHADDFLFLSDAHFDGAFQAAQGRQIGRPGALIAY